VKLEAKQKNYYHNDMYGIIFTRSLVLTHALAFASLLKKLLSLVKKKKKKKKKKKDSLKQLKDGSSFYPPCLTRYLDSGRARIYENIPLEKKSIKPRTK
jgi:hypothetical protein